MAAPHLVQEDPWLWLAILLHVLMISLLSVQGKIDEIMGNKCATERSLHV